MKSSRQPIGMTETSASIELTNKLKQKGKQLHRMIADANASNSSCSHPRQFHQELSLRNPLGGVHGKGPNDQVLSTKVQPFMPRL